MANVFIEKRAFWQFVKFFVEISAFKIGRSKSEAKTHSKKNTKNHWNHINHDNVK